LIWKIKEGIFVKGKLKGILEEKKPAILNAWFTVVAESYAEETAKFLRRQKDPFANPVGRAISKTTEELFDDLLTGPDYETAGIHLDSIIRVRSLQNFTPSSATQFIFSLKSVIRDAIGKDIHESGLEKEIVEFESRIDQLGLVAFDVYMKCREKVYELKSNEFRDRYYNAFRRAGLISEVAATPNLDKSNNMTKAP
jgi:hypothetical protein